MSFYQYHTEIRSVVKNAPFLTKDGTCTDPSTNFASYAYNLLPSEVKGSVALDQFSPCKYIKEIQEALNFASDGLSEVTFANLVTIPVDLENKLLVLFGTDVEFTGEWLLEQFGSTSVSRLLDFIGNFFTDDTPTSDSRLLTTSTDKPNRRRLKRGAVPHMHKSEAMRRGNIMRAVRNAASPPDVRQRKLNQISFLDGLVTLSFNFNFGGGEKVLSLGVQFDFDSDDTVKGSVEELLRTFLSETVGNNAQDDLGGFPFADAATDLAQGKLKCLFLSVFCVISFG